MLAKSFALLYLLPITIAIPFAAEMTKNKTIDTSSHCGQWDNITAGPYSLLLDQWGLSNATSGSDCASITSLCHTTIAWTNIWTWEGGNKVKSFTNMQLDHGLNKKLSAIKSIPAIWTWSQNSSGRVVADVAYDLYTSSTSGGSNVNEIMIWLANFNAGPLSAVYNQNGTPKPVASNVSLAGYIWDLYSGSNGFNNAFSFLPSNGVSITNFSGDLNVFLQYLVANQGIDHSQFLTTAQGGTEATLGSANFTTSAYSLVILDQLRWKGKLGS